MTATGKTDDSRDRSDVRGPTREEGEREPARREAEELEDGSLVDPDELDAEPAGWDEGSDDET